MRRTLLIFGLGLAALLAAAAAHAGWSSRAVGSGNAGARNLPAGNPPTVSLAGSAITVSWSQVTFAGAPLGTYSAGGYVVRRYADGSSTAITPGAACSETISGAGATLSCTETGVPEGTWHYAVTPALENWRGAESAQSAAPPINALTLVNQIGGGSYLSGSTLYYRGSASGGGSFNIQNAPVTSGSAPASSEFVALAGSVSGWTHTTPDLQTEPAGGPYASNPFAWTSGTSSSPVEAVTSRDGAGNATTTTLTFINDSAGPTGGALTVNGTTATGGGNSSLTNAGSWPIDARTDYSSDAGSGLLSSVLTVQYAPWSGAACGTFGPETTIAGSAAQTASYGDGCYKYTLTGTDHVGNTSQRITTVKVDQTAPATTDNTAALGGAWHNTTQTVTLTATDTPGSGVATTYYTTDGTTPTTSSLTGTSISLSATGVYTIKYFSVDAAGNQESVQTAGTQIRIDKVAPTNSLSIGSASGAYLSGSTLYFNRNTGGSFTLVDAVTDNHSGPASATFPGISTTGWTGHTSSETVSTGSGSFPTITYVSTTYTFAIAAGTPGSISVSSRDLANNVGAGASLTFAADTSATAPTVSFPTAGSRYNDTAWNSGCAGAICGTSSDGTGSGVQTVEVSIQQGAGNYWDGTGFSSASPVWNLAAGTSAWSLPFPAVNFPAEGSYTTGVRVTDRVGNVSAATNITFTIDRTAPTATNVALTNGGTLGVADKGDAVTVTYSEGMDATSFCSGWVNNGSNQTKSGSGGGVVVTITNNGTSDTLSVTAAGCTFHLGSVALNADYVSSSSTFSGNGGNASSVTWNPTLMTLTITFGTPASGSQNSSVPTSTPSYMPDAVLKDLAGNAIATGPFGGTLSRF